MKKKDTQQHTSGATIRLLSALPTVVVWGALLGVLWLGFALRYAGSDWGNPRRYEPGQAYAPLNYYHPDERGIMIKTQALAWQEPPEGRRPGEGALHWWMRRLQHNAAVDAKWNVGSFNYGEMPYHLLRIVADRLNDGREVRIAAGADPGSFWGVQWRYDTYGYLGRLLSAIAGAASILVLYLIGARVYNRLTGLLAALLWALCPLHVQLCHYYAFEPLLVLWVLIALYACVGVARRGWLSDYLLAAVAIAFAIATKFSAVLLPLALLVAHLCHVFGRGRDGLSERVDALRAVGIGAPRWPGLVVRAAEVVATLILLSWAARYFSWINHPAAVPAAFAERLCSLERFPFWFNVFVAAAGWLVATWIVRAVLWVQRLRRAPLRDCDRDWYALLARRVLAIARPWAGIVAAVYVALAALWMVQPHAFTESASYTQEQAAAVAAQRADKRPPGEFWRTVLEQKEMVQGKRDIHYVRQYYGATDFFYELSNLIWESLGPPLGVLALAGLLVACALAVLRPSPAAWVLLAWALPLFVIQCTFFVKFPRYHIAELPLFVLFGARLLERGLRLRVARPDALLRAVPWPWLHGAQLAALALLPLVVLYSLIYCRGMVEGFRAPHTWERASRWMADVLPAGAKLAFTQSDDTLPVAHLPGVSAAAYQQTAKLPLYAEDNDAKVKTIVDILTDADYLILPTKRLYGGTMNNPARYPLTSNLFRLLFAGDLGYTLVHTEREPIRIFGVEKCDDFADESFGVYERPKVHIFAKTEKLTAEQMTALIAGPPEFTRAITFRQVLAARADRSIWEVPLPRFVVARWLTALAVATWAAFPLVFIATAGTRLRGLVVAPIVGCLLVAYVPWLLAATRTAPFSRALVAATTLAGLAFSTWLARRHAAALRDYLRARAGDIAVCALVFLAFFGLFLTIRAYNPNIYWGEKPMEYSFLNAVERTETFPPQDPWIAGRHVNYYYYGYVIFGALGKLAGLPPRYVFNLAVATVPALAALVAFGILLELTRRYRYGLVAALLLCCGGSLLAYELFLFNHQQTLVAQNPEALRIPGDKVFAETRAFLMEPLPAVYHRGAEALRDYPLPAAIWETAWTAVAYLAWLPTALRHCWLLLSGNGETLQASLTAIGFDAWFWKCAHGSIPGTAASEYPAWTFLFADLHPHMIVMPFTLALIFLALLLLPGFQRPGLRGCLHYVLLGLLLGAITCINTWDMPTSLLLLVFALGLRWGRRHGVPAGSLLWALRRLRSRGVRSRAAARAWITAYLLLREVLWPLLIITMVALVLFQPFHGWFVPRDKMGLGVVSSGYIRPELFARVFGVPLFFVLIGVVALYLRCRTRWGRTAAVLGLIALGFAAPLFPGLLQRIAAAVVESPLVAERGRQDARARRMITPPPLQQLTEHLRTHALPAELQWRVGEFVRDAQRQPFPETVPVPEDLIAAVNAAAGGTVIVPPVRASQLFPRWLWVAVGGWLAWCAAWLALLACGRGADAGRRYGAIMVGLAVAVAAPLLIGATWVCCALWPLLRQLGTVTMVGAGGPALGNEAPFALAALLAVPVLLAWAALLRRSLPADAHAPLLLALVGLGVAAGIEVLMVREGDWGNTRWNTIFKFHLHVWMYLVLAAAALWWALFDGRATRCWRRGATRWSLTALGVALAVMALTFGLAGALTVTRAPGARCVRGERPTLDGLAYLRAIAPHDYDLITCLNANVAGAPTVVQAPCDSYHHDVCRLAWNTGLPTLITWAHHVGERNHSDAEISQRTQEARMLYRGEAEAVARIARRRNVDYIALGPGETTAFGSAARETLEQAGAYLSLVRRFRADNVRQELYKVRHDLNRLYLPQPAGGGTATSYIQRQPGLSLAEGESGAGNGQFDQPRGLSTGPDGRLYVADLRNHRIQVFSATGEFEYALGVQGSGPREFNEPNDIAVGPDQRVYVADTWNNRVQVLDPAGRVVADYNPQAASFYGPRGVCLLRDGRLVVADAGHHNVTVLDRDGNVVFVVGRSDRRAGDGNGELKEPRGVAPLSDGGFVVCDAENARLQLFTSRGRWRKTIPVPYRGYQGGPNDTFVAAAPDDTLYVSDGFGRRVLVFSAEGELLGQITAGPHGPFRQPTGVALDPTGATLYVADGLAHRVHAVPLAGALQPADDAP